MDKSFTTAVVERVKKVADIFYRSKQLHCRKNMEE